VRGNRSKASALGYAAALLVLCGGSVACSKGSGNGSDSYSKAVGALAVQISGPSQSWAEAAKAVYEGQVGAGGSVDAVPAGKSLAVKSGELGQRICDAVAKSSRLKKPGKNDETTELTVAIQNSVIDAFSSVNATSPKLLVAFGMTTWGKWPPSMLKDAKVDADLPVAATPEELAKHVRPEFLDGQATLKIPAPSDPAFHDFRQWYLFDSNGRATLRNIAYSTAGDVFKKTSDC
jgi:hypothetical protein